MGPIDDVILIGDMPFVACAMLLALSNGVYKDH